MPTPDPALPQAIDDCRKLLKWLIPLPDKFPRNRRFTLGERLEPVLPDVPEDCVGAAYGKHTRTQLSAASRRRISDGNSHGHPGLKVGGRSCARTD